MPLPRPRFHPLGDPVDGAASHTPLPPPADDYVASFRPTLMDVVYAWSKGASFGDICGLTEMMEGSIIRCAGRACTLLSCQQLFCVPCLINQCQGRRVGVGCGAPE